MIATRPRRGVRSCHRMRSAICGGAEATAPWALESTDGFDRLVHRTDARQPQWRSRNLTSRQAFKHEGRQQAHRGPDKRLPCDPPERQNMPQIAGFRRRKSQSLFPISPRGFRARSLFRSYVGDAARTCVRFLNCNDRSMPSTCDVQFVPNVGSRRVDLMEALQQ